MLVRSKHASVPELVHGFEHTLSAGKPLALHRQLALSGSVPLLPASTLPKKREQVNFTLLTYSQPYERRA